MRIFTILKSTILSLTIFLFPFFFLPTTQEYFATNKLYLLSIGAILLLLVSSVEIILTKKIHFYKQQSTPEVNPNHHENTSGVNLVMFIFLLSITLSIFISSPNRVQAILNPNFGLLSILSLSIVSFYIRGSDRTVAPALSLASLILSVIAIFFFVRQSPFFSPIGSQIDLAVFLGFALLIQLTQLLTNLKRPSQLGKFFAKIIFAITLAGSIISINSLLATGLSNLPPFRYSTSSALENFKDPKTALFGVGVDNYSTLFTKVKDAAYNQSKFWQIDSFNVGRSAFLHILTEAGLFGLVSFLLLFIFLTRDLLKKQRLMLIPIIYLAIAFLILPPSLTLFFLFYVCKPSGFAEKQTNPEGYISINPFFYAVPLILILFVAASSYLLGRSYLAEYYFKKSLDTFIKSKNAKDIYDNQRLAVVSNPYIERFRVSFSQTNLLIANNISASQKADRQTITQAIKAAIEEAKATVSLNDQKARNWENLALIYRNLINTAQGADAWAISSYQRAIVLDPQNANYRLNLGGIYYLLKNYVEAIRLFEQAAALKPDWPNTHYNLAWAYFQKGNYQNAVSEMQTVLKLLDPKKDKSYLDKARKDLEQFKQK